MDNMEGLTPTTEESEIQLELQRKWALYRGSRLRDEAYITAEDGTSLHAYYYDEGSSVTVVVTPPPWCRRNR